MAAQNTNTSPTPDTSAEVVGKLHVSGRVGEDPERTGYHGGGQDREPVETVGQIDGVTRSDDHEVGKRDEPQAERQGDGFEKRHDERGLDRRLGRVIEKQRDRQSGKRLQAEFRPRADAAGILVDELLVIVDPTDEAEGKCGEEHHPNEAIAQVGP